MKTITWICGTKTEDTERFGYDCPFCGERTITGLPSWELAKQPDETTAVCIPALGGCNQGFSIEGFGLCLVDNG